MLKNKISPKHNLILSFDDYCPQNYRIAKILRKRGLTGTFFVELNHPESEQQIKDLHDMGFEIGSHTVTHPPDLKELNWSNLAYEIGQSKKMIESITGVPCTSFCYPKGKHNDDVIKMVQNQGYTDARTTHVLQLKTQDPFRTPTTIHVFSGRKEYDDIDWFNVANRVLKKWIREGGDFHIWGHGWEIDRDDEWTQFKIFLEKIKTSVL